MNKYLEVACEQIDAGMFSSDYFNQEENRATLKIYMGRWNREIERIEKILSEQEKENCVCPHSKIKQNQNSASDDDKYVCTVCEATYF